MFIFALLLIAIGVVLWFLKNRELFKTYNAKSNSYTEKAMPKPLMGGAIGLWTLGGILLIKSSLFYLSVGEAAHIQFYVPTSQVVHTTPGLHYSLFGKITYWKTVAWAEYFSKYDKDGGKDDDEIPVRFRDGTKATITGSIRYRIPPDEKIIAELQKEYQSWENFRQHAVRQIMAKTVGLTANFMTAEESYTTKKNDFMAIVRDQLINGQYDTITKVIDGIPQSVIKYKEEKEDRLHNRTEKQKLEEREVARISDNLFQRFNIDLQDVAIKEIDYEEQFDKMIMAKREAVQQAVIAKQQAERAIQDTIKAEEEGKKNVKVAEYKALEEKKTATINAEKERDVASLNLEKEKLNSQAVLVAGKADADVRKLKMVSDGALEQKLDALVKIHTAWANGKQMLVPTIAGGDTSGGNSAINANLINAVLAKQLGVDVNLKNTADK